MDEPATAPPVALVSGASSGLGAAVARLLRADGWRVGGLDLRPLPGELDAAATADVADADATERAVEALAAALDGFDTVVHAAGAVIDPLTPIEALRPESWDRIVAVNLSGAFHVLRAALPRVRDGGSVVLVASCVATAPEAGGAAYAAAKAGVASLARSVALEQAHRGVRAVSVSPGFMDTPMAAELMRRAHLREAIEAGIPLGRVASADEVAAVIAFLCGPGGSYLSGQDVVVDGGKAVSAYCRPDQAERVRGRRADRR